VTLLPREDQKKSICPSIVSSQQRLLRGINIRGVPPLKMASSTNTAEALNTVIATTTSLVAQLEGVVATVANGTSTGQENATSGSATSSSTSNASIDALALCSDSATLLKAHATKISLFIINEPFTPSAIVKVLREISSGALPGLASAVQICDPARYTKVVQKELAWRVGRVLKEFKELVARIPQDGKILSGAKKDGFASKGTGQEKGSIATTGVLWSACDDIVQLGKMGVAGYLVHKVEQFRDTLKDVMEELKEWAEESDEAALEDENGEDDEDQGEGESADVAEVTQSLQATHISDTQAMLDDLMDSQPHIPRDDPDQIRMRLDSCLRRLRLTTLLYQAVVKRRLKILPKLPQPVSSPDSTYASRLDEVMPVLGRIPDGFSNLALAFYDLEPSEIDRLMDQCFFDAFAVSELLVKSWDGRKDEFADWAAKFQVEIKKN
jgi:hypothetical protein